MVDASIGGKCGVNLQNYGKNQIGRIYFPAKVVIWSNWLSSLPAIELLSGVGECLKHAMIAGDRNLFREVVTASSISREKDENYFKDLLTKLINIKADICQKDPFEMNVRNYLNLGHTLAHALEAEALERDHTLSHGQAVAYGLQFCLLVAKNLGEIKQDDFDYYWQGILNAKIIGHPSATLALSKEQLMSEAFFESLLKFILQDKKNLSPQQTFQWIVPCTKNPSSLYAVKQVTVDEHFIKKIWFDEYSPFLSKYY